MECISETISFVCYRCGPSSSASEPNGAAKPSVSSKELQGPSSCAWKLNSLCDAQNIHIAEH